MDRTASAAARVAPDRQEPPLWPRLRVEAEAVCRAEPMLAGLARRAVLEHDGLGPALAALLARKVADDAVGVAELRAVIRAALADDATIVSDATSDLEAIRARDPAAGDTCLRPFLFYKGFHALEVHRVAHWLWRHERRDLALFLQSRASEVFGVDIHPAVPMGHGVFIDHGTGVVIGETAVVGNDVSILQGVTLGGTGKEAGDRHPKVRDGVLLSVGAKVLGNIEIGRNAKVGAGSIVLKDVPPCATVVGVPARIVGWCRDGVPGLDMDQTLTERD